MKRHLLWVQAPVGIVHLYWTCNEVATPWVSFTSNLLDLSLNVTEVHVTVVETKSLHDPHSLPWVPLVHTLDFDDNRALFLKIFKE